MNREDWANKDATDPVAHRATVITTRDGRSSASVYDASGCTVAVLCDRNHELVIRALERLGLVRA